jgi:hypothetical protein
MEAVHGKKTSACCLEAGGGKDRVGEAPRKRTERREEGRTEQKECLAESAKDLKNQKNQTNNFRGEDYEQ